MRNTLQKQLVLSAVQKATTHPTAEDIYNLIKESYPDISLATVYRNLKKLSEAKKIRKIQIPNSADRFDRSLHPHYHIYCNKCQSFKDVEIDYLNDLDETVRNFTGYDIEEHDIVFKGLCERCKTGKSV